MAQVKPLEDPTVYDPPPQPPAYQQPQVITAQPAQSNTTVIVQQQQQPTSAMPRMWSTGICGCLEDIPTCCCGMFCELCLHCSVASDMGESPCVPCCVPGSLITLRTKWRTQQNIQGSVLGDCVDAHFCGPCVLCQLAREVKNARRAQPMR